MICSYCTHQIGWTEISFIGGKRCCPNCGNFLKVDFICPRCEETFNDAPESEFTKCVCCNAVVCTHCAIMIGVTIGEMRDKLS